MATTDAPKPGPHLHQPPTLAELAELHARAAHELLVHPLSDGDQLDWSDRALAADVHAAVARACAHAAIANRPAFHRTVKL